MSHQIPFVYPPGATPLDLNELAGLIPTYISTQGELNQLEQENILKGRVWLDKVKAKRTLTIPFVLELHTKMFGDVWEWAGKQRYSEKSIGVAWSQITSELPKLLADVEYWIQNKTYDVEEIGVRFHHRLVAIHVFPNGNGRHARLITDKLVRDLGSSEFTWGRLAAESELAGKSLVRDEYISALKQADKRQYAALLKFARS